MENDVDVNKKDRSFPQLHAAVIFLALFGFADERLWLCLFFFPFGNVFLDSKNSQHSGYSL